MARIEHRPGSQLPVMPPTLADVAERAGVSRQTVSNAVNNPDLLRPDTLERVRQTIAELGYSPNRAARNLRTRTSQLIGLRFAPAQEGTANAAMDRFVHSLVETSREAGYHVLLFAGDPREATKGYDDLLRSTAVDAFVVTDTYLGNPQAAWLRDRRAPFVSFGRPWDDPAKARSGARTAVPSPHPWVDVDGADGVAQATRRLLDTGHRRIGFVGWPDGSEVGDDRRSGWFDTLRSAGLDPTGLDRAAPDGFAQGEAAARDLLAGAEPPTAIVCASDSLALGVLQAVRGPGDWAAGSDQRPRVAVTGFDDTPVAQAIGLTSVSQPLAQAAACCVDLLADVLDGGLRGGAAGTRRSDPAGGGPGQVLLRPSLVVRQSG